MPVVVELDLPDEKIRNVSEGNLEAGRFVFCARAVPIVSSPRSLNQIAGPDNDPFKSACPHMGFLEFMVRKSPAQDEWKDQIFVMQRQLGPAFPCPKSREADQTSNTRFLHGGDNVQRSF